MEKLIEWFLVVILDDDQIILVYGDYFFYNIFCYLIELCVVVVFDWEFCIIGYFLGDFIYNIMFWYCFVIVDGCGVFCGKDIVSLGIFLFEDYVIKYCEWVG